MTSRPCETCHTVHPRERTVCGERLEQLRILLTGLPQLVVDMKRPGRVPIDVAWTVRETVLIWTVDIAARRSHRTPQSWGQIGRYLRQALPWLGTAPDGPQIVDELTHVLMLARARQPHTRSLAA